MIEITEKEYKQFELLKKMFMTSFPDRFPDAIFICGESTKKDAQNFPEHVTICNAYGSDIVKIYKRIDHD